MEIEEITREGNLGVGLFACVFFDMKKTFTEGFDKSLGDVTISWNIKKGVGSE